MRLLFDSPCFAEASEVSSDDDEDEEGGVVTPTGRHDNGDDDLRHIYLNDLTSEQTYVNTSQDIKRKIIQQRKLKK